MPSSPYISHPVYGYWHRPGESKVLITDSSGKEYSFTMGFSADGSRRSPAGIPSCSVLREDCIDVLVLGDSYLEGYGLNDESVFSAVLQVLSPQLSIRNHAGGGFGNTHALLQLENLSSKNKKAPDVLIVGYGDYYLQRNVAAPERMKTYKVGKSFASSHADLSDFFHPRASLKDGKLHLDSVPLFWSQSKGIVKETDISEQIKITKLVLGSIYDQAKAWGVKHVWIAYLSGGMTDDPVISDAVRKGYSIIDLRRNLGPIIDSDGVPLDGHPGALAHNTYARKIKNFFDLHGMH